MPNLVEFSLNLVECPRRKGFESVFRQLERDENDLVEEVHHEISYNKAKNPRNTNKWQQFELSKFEENAHEKIKLMLII